jgi:hypothetical protein
METQIVKSKPRNVERAIIVMWIVMGLSALSSVLNFSYLSSQTGVAVALVSMGFSYAWMIFIFVMVAAGKNWARWTLLVLFILGLFMIPFLLAQWSAMWLHSPVSVLLNLAGFPFQAFILYLVFTPAASPWFHQVNDQTGLQNEVTVHTTTHSTTASQPTVDLDISTQNLTPAQRPKPPVDYSDRT